MAHSDKTLGTTISDGVMTHEYSTHKVEYDSEDSLEDLITVTVENEDGVMVEVSLAKSEQTLTEYLGHAINQDLNAGETYTADGTEQPYSRRVIVGSQEARNAVTNELDNLGITNDSFTFALSDKEKHIIERESATNDAQVNHVLHDKRDILDRSLVEDETRLPIAEAILTTIDNDPGLGNALDNIFEVVTGETAQETVNRLT